MAAVYLKKSVYIDKNGEPILKKYTNIFESHYRGLQHRLFFNAVEVFHFNAFARLRPEALCSRVVRPFVRPPVRPADCLSVCPFGLHVFFLIER